MVVIVSHSIPTALLSRAEQRARTYYAGLTDRLRRRVELGDLVSEAQLVLLSRWAAAAAHEVDTFWTDVQPELLQALDATVGVQPTRPAVVTEIAWWQTTVTGTERFWSDAGDEPIDVALDDRFARRFLTAAAAQIAHVMHMTSGSGSFTCECAPTDHDSMLAAADRWTLRRLRRATRLTAMLDHVLTADDELVRRVLEQAAGVADDSRSLQRCCAAMWFGIARVRDIDRTRDQRVTRVAADGDAVDHRPVSSGHGSGSRSGDVEIAATPAILLAAAIATEDTRFIDCVMDVAHRLLVGSPVHDAGGPIATLSEQDGQLVVVKPTSPTRVVVARVLRQIFLAIAAGERRRSFYKLALVASGRILRPEPIASSDARRNSVDQRVTRVAINAVFVLCQRSQFEKVWRASVADGLWHQVEQATHTSRDQIESMTHLRFALDASGGGPS